jgi:hypothetical protein
VTRATSATRPTVTSGYPTGRSFRRRWLILLAGTRGAQGSARRHDALEFPDGEMVLLTYLMEGQQATVLQLPATAVESKAPAPERAAYVLDR